MTYGNDTITLRDRFERLKKDNVEAYEAFKEYIVSPNFSLDLRWQMFLDAPWDFSPTRESTYNGLNFLNKPHEIYPEILFKWMNVYKDFGDDVYTIDLVNELENGSLKSLTDGWPIFQEPDIINRIKEQILKDNVKSFMHK